MFEKSLAPLVTKFEEHLQSSIEKSIQRIQKENRASQQETVKKLEDLTKAMSKITEYIKLDTSRAVTDTKTAAVNSSKLAGRKQMMGEQFKAGNYSAGIETVCLRNGGTEVQWSDSSDTEQAALFEVCLEYNPSILSNVEQLTLMSAANAVSIDLKSRLEERLVWLEKIVALAKREVYLSSTPVNIIGPLYRILASCAWVARSTTRRRIRRHQF